MNLATMAFIIMPKAYEVWPTLLPLGFQTHMKFLHNISLGLLLSKLTYICMVHISSAYCNLIGIVMLRRVQMKNEAVLLQSPPT
jgi:hypothetical protein